MVDAASILYPSAAPQRAAPAPTGSSAAERLYPAHAQPARTPAPAAATVLGAPPVPPAPEAATAPAQAAPESAQPPAPERATPEQALYADLVPTTGRVDFAEPVAAPADIRLQVPMGWENTPEAQAERQQLVEAMAEAGAGRTFAAEMWSDITRAATRPVTVTPEVSMAELRKVWGPATEAKIAAARGVLQQVAQRFPGTAEFLERSGLGNDPGFIRKLAARAARMPARR